jgi:hypothetical protein
MKLAIEVLFSNSVTPLLAVVSPLSYQVFPVRLMSVIRVPAGNGEVNLTYPVMPSTENSDSNLISAAGLLAPLFS